MKKIFSAFIITATLFSLSGCYRAKYYNFTPAQFNEPRVGYKMTSHPKRVSGNQPFFISGLVPGIHRVNAAELCNGADNIDYIGMRQTTGQVFTNLFVPEFIYSPRSGAVYCKAQR